MVYILYILTPRKQESLYHYELPLHLTKEKIASANEKITDANAAKYTGRVNIVVYKHDHFKPNATKCYAFNIRR